jgi:hypothetical protein
MDIDKEELVKGFKVTEYRKIGMRWCKLSRMFGEREAVLRRYQSLYKAYIQDGGEPFSKELNL